jgi:hypothetical protein
VLLLLFVTQHDALEDRSLCHGVGNMVFVRISEIGLAFLPAQELIMLYMMCLPVKRLAYHIQENAM